MPDRIVNITDIGDVRFVQSRKAKRINIVVKSFHNIKVSVPARVSFASAKSFVTEKKNWINKHRENLKNDQKYQLIFDENSNFKSKHHTLRIFQTSKEKINYRISSGEIIVCYPSRQKVSDESVQQIIRKGIEEALRVEAKDFIPARVLKLADLHNFSFNKIFIKKNKSRWGSCSQRNNLNFSLHLMMLPMEMIDYVILHELAHTVEHNHSKNFWILLDDIYGNAKVVDKKLKNYRIGL
ncbi:M48 family metallopeptidase [Bacteroidota bacterium]